MANLKDAGETIELMIRTEKNPNRKLGELLFEMETTYGFPVELTLEEIDTPTDPEDYFSMIDTYLSLKINHAIMSGMEFMGNRHLKMIEKNIKALDSILEGNLKYSNY